MTMLLVLCGFPGILRTSLSRAAADQTEKLSFEAAGSNSDLAKGVPEDLLERGNNLLREGEITEAVHVLDSALLEWEEQLGIKVSYTSDSEVQHGDPGQEVDSKRVAEITARAVRVSEKGHRELGTMLANSIHGLGLALLERGKAPSGTDAVRRALQFRPLESGVESLDRVAGVVLEYVEALSKLPSDADEAELDGALGAIDVINRLAWRYFVEHKPAEGHKVLQKVTTTVLDEGKEKPTRDTLLKVLTMSAYLFNLGFLRLAVLGDYSGAAELFKQAYELRVPQLGEEHALTVQVVVSRGWALTLIGQTETMLEELIRCAQTLMVAGQAPAAERLLRQAIDSAMNPLGPHTYAHACFTQHVNFLKSKNSQPNKLVEEFTRERSSVAKTATLRPRHEGVATARKLLAEVLLTQASETRAGEELLRLSDVDRKQLRNEAAALGR